MTSPTSPLPVDYEAPPVNPIGLGLYSAANLIDVSGPSRILNGVAIRPFNCSNGWGTWDTDPCADPAPGVRKDGDRASARDPFDPFVVWGYDECGAAEPVDALESRALQNARLHEQALAETHFGTRIIADAGTAAATTDLVSAVGELELELATAGFVGVIHASARFAAVAARFNLIVRSGATLRTPMGHAWAFGAGYEDPLGKNLVATGPVTVWRDAYAVRNTFDHAHNIKAAVAERAVVVGYECAVAAAAAV